MSVKIWSKSKFLPYFRSKYKFWPDFRSKYKFWPNLSVKILILTEFFSQKCVKIFLTDCQSVEKSVASSDRSVKTIFRPTFFWPTNFGQNSDQNQLIRSKFLEISIKISVSFYSVSLIVFKKMHSKYKRINSKNEVQATHIFI